MGAAESRQDLRLSDSDSESDQEQHHHSSEEEEGYKDAKDHHSPLKTPSSVDQIEAKLKALKLKYQFKNQSLQNPVKLYVYTVEINVILVLLFRTPLRKLVMFALDRLKEGRGPIMSTVAVTLFAVLMSSLYSIVRIQKRSMDTGGNNPADQVLLANHILDSSLLGFCLFFGLMIDRLHYYVRKFDDSEDRSCNKTKQTYETESD